MPHTATQCNNEEQKDIVKYSGENSIPLRIMVNENCFIYFVYFCLKLMIIFANFAFNSSCHNARRS